MGVKYKVTLGEYIAGLKRIFDGYKFEKQFNLGD
jgi:hypothetical protein